MRDIGTTKAAGIDRLPGRVLRDATDVLAKPVADICNFSISLNKLPGAFRLAKVKPISKNGQKNKCLKLPTYLLTAITFKGH